MGRVISVDTLQAVLLAMGAVGAALVALGLPGAALIAGLLGAGRPALVPGDGLVRVVVERRGLGGVDGGIVGGRSGVWRRIPVDMVVGRHEGAAAVLGGSRRRVVVVGGAVQGGGNGGEVRVERRAHGGQAGGRTGIMGVRRRRQVRTRVGRESRGRQRGGRRVGGGMRMGMRVVVVVMRVRMGMGRRMGIEGRRIGAPLAVVGGIGRKAMHWDGGRSVRA